MGRTGGKKFYFIKKFYFSLVKVVKNKIIFFSKLFGRPLFGGSGGKGETNYLFHLALSLISARMLTIG